MVAAIITFSALVAVILSLTCFLLIKYLGLNKLEDKTNKKVSKSLKSIGMPCLLIGVSIAALVVIFVLYLIERVVMNNFYIYSAISFMVAVMGLNSFANTSLNYCIYDEQGFEIHQAYKKSVYVNMSDIKKCGIDNALIYFVGETNNLLGYFPITNTRIEEIIVLLNSKDVSMDKDLKKAYGIVVEEEPAPTEEVVEDGEVKETKELVKEEPVEKINPQTRAKFEDVGRLFKENFKSFLKSEIIKNALIVLLMSGGIIALFLLMNNYLFLILFLIVAFIIYSKVKELLKAKRDVENASDFDLGNIYLAYDKRVVGYSKNKIRQLKSNAILFGLVFVMAIGLTAYLHFSNRDVDESVLAEFSGTVKEVTDSQYGALISVNEKEDTYYVPSSLSPYFNKDGLLQVSSGSQVVIKYNANTSASSHDSYYVKVNEVEYMNHDAIAAYFKAYKDRTGIYFYVSIGLASAVVVYYVVSYLYYKKIMVEETIDVYE